LIAPAGSLRRAALAVKIENTPDARPQSGLEHADIVYEEVVEGGITRFMAIFQSQEAPVLGPVRSARPEDPDLARQFHVVFAYSGAANYVVRLVEHTPGIHPLAPGQALSAFHRVSFRFAPHNLYSSTEALWAAAGKYAQGPPPQMFTYSRAPLAPTPTPSPSASPVPTALPTPTASPTPKPVVVPGRSLSIDFSTREYEARWVYDRATETYLRFEGSAPFMTASGHQIRARDVLVMFVRTYSARHLDAAHHSTPVAIVVGTGGAILFRNGLRESGHWSRASIGRLTMFTRIDGLPMLFAPGNTWIELVPIGTKLGT
jgi:hypothetical protein